LSSLPRKEAVKPIEVSYHDPDIAIVTLLGEHDLAGGEELEQTLRQLLQSGEHIVVDLSETEFIDSSVLNNLVRATNEGRELGLSLVLQLSTAPNVRRVLEVTGLLERLPCASSREEAVRLARTNTRPGD
jgi:anti-anti-sigma factor